MMNKPVKTVSATCACGASFTREVKRGRPQVWCPSCVLVPFYERTAGSAIPTVAAIVEAVGTTERIPNENDRLDHVREAIDLGMAEINLNHKARFAALVASGLSPFDAATKAQAETLAATQNLYALQAPKFYTPGRETEDDA